MAETGSGKQFEILIKTCDYTKFLIDELLEGNSSLLNIPHEAFRASNGLMLSLLKLMQDIYSSKQKEIESKIVLENKSKQMISSFDAEVQLIEKPPIIVDLQDYNFSSNNQSNLKNDKISAKKSVDTAVNSSNSNCSSDTKNNMNISDLGNFPIKVEKIEMEIENGDSANKRKRKKGTSSDSSTTSSDSEEESSRRNSLLTANFAKLLTFLKTDTGPREPHYYCKICDAVIVTIARWNTHVNKVHSISNPKNKFLSCDTCHIHFFGYMEQIQILYDYHSQIHKEITLLPQLAIPQAAAESAEQPIHHDNVSDYRSNQDYRQKSRRRQNLYEFSRNFKLPSKKGKSSYRGKNFNRGPPAKSREH